MEHFCLENRKTHCRGIRKAKLKGLQKALTEMERVLVAFSGGVDSTFLLHIAAGVVPGRVFAVTAVSPLVAGSELEDAKTIAGQEQVPHLLMPFAPLEVPGFAQNPRDRCYICKRACFQSFSDKAGQLDGAILVDGTNADDAREFRPGLKAAAELGVRSPLCEAGLTKAEIRMLSRELHLPTWDKPSSPCMATRFPYGRTITPEAVERVKKAEKYLHGLGYGTVRVRSYKDMTSIEVEAFQISQFLEQARTEHLVDYICAMGLPNVSLDMEGFKSGKMDAEFFPNLSIETDSELRSSISP